LIAFNFIRKISNNIFNNYLYLRNFTFKFVKIKQTYLNKITYLKMKKSVKMDISKVVDLFESSYTEQLYDRKASFIVKLCEDRSKGFFYNDLP